MTNKYNSVLENKLKKQIKMHIVAMQVQVQVVFFIVSTIIHERNSISYL